MSEAYCQIKDEDYVTVEEKIYSCILKMWSLLKYKGMTSKWICEKICTM